MPRQLVRCFAIFCATNLGFFISAETSHAGIILVTSHTAIGANDYVDWGSASLGQAPGSPPPTNSSIPNPYFFQSGGGISTRVSKPIGAGAFTFFIQGGVGQDFDHGGYWGGNFTPGDNLLNTSLNDPGPITIAFKSAVAAAGANISTNSGGQFEARITAYDGNNNQLSSFTEVGTSAPTKDGSAIFLGVLSNTMNIASIQFSIDIYPPSPPPGVGYTDFTVNQLEIATYLKGDFNRDGHVDAGDIALAMAALSDTPNYGRDHGFNDPTLFGKTADVNGDGKFTNADLQYLLNTLKSGGGSADLVPEPPSAILALLGTAVLFGGSAVGRKRLTHG